jgi:putative transposase
VPPIDERLKILIAELVTKWGQELIELKVMPDHLHLLLGCDLQFGIARLLRYLKGASSYQLRGEFPELRLKMPSLWTNSYFISTAGVTLETLKLSVKCPKPETKCLIEKEQIKRWHLERINSALTQIQSKANC